MLWVAVILISVLHKCVDIFQTFEIIWNFGLKVSSCGSVLRKVNVYITSKLAAVFSHFCYLYSVHYPTCINIQGRWPKQHVAYISMAQTWCVSIAFNITKTYLYNFDPLKPHFYIVKLGFTGVYIIFLISAQNIGCGYSLEPPHRGGSNEYPQSMFWAEIWKISEFLSEFFSVFRGEIFYIFE